MEPIAISTGTLAHLVQRPYWDLEAAAEAAVRLGRPPLELVLLPEWDCEAPPVTDQARDWERAREGHYLERAAELVGRARLTVASVHAGRDLGKLLAMGPAERSRANRQLAEAVAVARALGASHVVLHAWDTFAVELQPGSLAKRLLEAFPEPGGLCVPPAVEAIPVSVPGWTPGSFARAVAGELRRRADARAGSGAATAAGTVIDLNWCALAGDLQGWLAGGENAGGGPPPGPVPPGPVWNIHVGGRVAGPAGLVAPTHGHLDYPAALRKLRSAYPAAQLTLELRGPHSLEDVRQALGWLRSGAGTHGAHRPERCRAEGCTPEGYGLDTC